MLNDLLSMIKLAGQKCGRIAVRCGSGYDGLSGLAADSWAGRRVSGVRSIDFNKGMVRYAFFIWLYAIFVERISSYSVNHRVARVLFLCESVFAPAMNEADLV
ncbi:MAG TPA: hypothetical protein VL635_18700 [Trinickia sp.]|jgi:hypothetical protein|nr:hypothetical protein [Trinickia sp.]